MWNIVHFLEIHMCQMSCDKSMHLNQANKQYFIYLRISRNIFPGRKSFEFCKSEIWRWVPQVLFAYVSILPVDFSRFILLLKFIQKWILRNYSQNWNVRKEFAKKLANYSRNFQFEKKNDFFKFQSYISFQSSILKYHTTCGKLKDLNQYYSQKLILI